jgi:hypothetical protein
MKEFSKILAFAAISAASSVALANGDGYHHPLLKEGFIVGIDGGYGYLSTPEAIYPNNYNNYIYKITPVVEAVMTDSMSTAYKYTSDTDTGGFAWGAHIGYDFVTKPNMLVGFELGYKDLGKSMVKMAYKSYNVDSDSYYYQGSRKYTQNAVDALLTTNYFIYKGLNIFGKAGAAYVRSDIDQHATSDFDSSSPNGIPLSALEGDNSIWRIEPEISLGVGYLFDHNLDLHAAYTYVGGANDQSIEDRSSSASNLPKARVYSTNMLMIGISYTF